MWPWGHLAVGYLCYALVLRVRRRSVDGATALLLVVGTQLPDVVDKPLAWVGVLPAGRSLAHSLLVAVPLAALVLTIARRADRLEPAAGFVFGYGSHLFADSYRSLFAGQFEDLTFLLWPVLPLPDYGRDSPVDHFDALVRAAERLDPAIVLREPMGAFTGQVALFVLAGAVWLSGGAPGVALLWRVVRRVFGGDRD